MRVAGEAIARQTGIENGDLAAGTAELQGGGKAGKAAADDDDVIHGDGLRVVNGGEWLGLAMDCAWARLVAERAASVSRARRCTEVSLCCGSAQYRPTIRTRDEAASRA